MTRSLISPFIAVAVILFFIAGVRTQEVEDESEFEYNDGPRGPAHWGELNDEWKACGDGTQQSPIDLNDAQNNTDPGTLRIFYHPAHATLINRGHDIMLNWSEDAGGIMLDYKNFILKQCHWHTPAEHTLDGQTPHPLELHLVHQAEDGEIAVIGIIYKDGEADDFLAKLMDGILALAADNDTTVQPLEDKVDPNDAQFDVSKYYRYDGSLTTPACTEGVNWIVIYQVKTVSDNQVSALQAAVHDGFGMNARPIQAINERTLTLYTPMGDIYAYVS